MLRKLNPPKRLTALCRISAAALPSRYHPSTGAERQPADWISANHTFRKHPRLLSLEQCNSFRRLKPLLAYVIVSGLFRNPFVASRVLHSCTAVAPPSDLAFASLVFSQMEAPNLFSWNTLIRAFAASGHQQHLFAALSLYVEMLQRGTLPDNFTLPFLLESCRSAPDLDLGRRIHTHALILGFLVDPFVHTALVSMYLNCGSSGDAVYLFDEISHKDVVSWTAVISGLVDQGCHWHALEVFNAMRSVGSDVSVSPNVATMVSAMSACACLGYLDHVESLHAYLEKVGLEGDVFVRNALIDAYAKCGSITCAAQMFDRMCERDLHSWTAMITGLASHGLGKEAHDVFLRMQRVGVKPDSVTFVAVLSACSHAGLVDEGVRIFDSMEKVYAINPQDKHCGCMVDLFSRAGLLSRAYDFIMSMPTEPNLVIMGALLSACRVRNNLELGELVSNKIKSDCQYQGGAHVLLSNMYASQNEWNEVISIREATKGHGGKPPGQSWIEVRGVVHEFGVEDRSHPLAEEIYSVLDRLRKSMERLTDPLSSFPFYWHP